jgi:adenylate cyclase
MGLPLRQYLRWILRLPGVHLVAASIAGLVLVVYFLAPGFFQTLSVKVYDLHFALRAVRDPGDAVVILAVDEKSLAEIGRWPWPRAVLAQIVERLAAAGTRAIAFDILLSEPQVSGELRAASRLGERFRASGLARRPEGEAFLSEIETVRRQADDDARLEEAIRASGRVVLPVVFTLAPDAAVLGGRLPERKGAPFKSALVGFRGYSERGLYPPPRAATADLPIPRLVAAARELGHVTMIADTDGTTRWEALVFEHHGHYYPSLAVQAVRVALDIDAVALKLDFGQALEVGPFRVPVDARNRTLVDYAGPTATVRHLSAVDVIAGRVPTDAIRDRIVFIGTTAAGAYDLRVTPVSPILPGVEKHANVAANILAGRYLTRPVWVELVEVAMVVLWPFVLAALLSRVRPIWGLTMAVLSLAAVFGGAHLAFRGGLWLPVVYPSFAIVLTTVGVNAYLYVTEERQRKWMRHAFERFVSPEVVGRIVRDPDALQFGGELKTLTILFTDIRDFTGYTQRNPPSEVVHVLRECNTRMVSHVIANQGTLDKFVGDAIMALFGAPLTQPDHAERACRTALAMAEELRTLQERWRAEGREPFRMGIGINTGEVVVGNLGSDQLFDYTAVGDAVNVGSRLESLNKEIPTPNCILISESTYEAAREAIEARRISEVAIRGREQPVAVYELLGMRIARGVPAGVDERVMPVAVST